MNKEEILRQCIEGNAVFNMRSKFSKQIDFCKRNLEKLARPKFDVFDVTRQTAYNSKEYPIFFIKERKIFWENGKISWRYFGSLFDIVDNKVIYKTTTDYIQERCLQKF